MMQRFALILLLSLSIQYSAAESSSSNLRAGATANYDHHHQRRQLGFSNWFSNLMFALAHGCPPIGPAHAQCVARAEAREAYENCIANSGTDCTYSVSSDNSASSASGSSTSDSNENNSGNSNSGNGDSGNGMYGTDDGGDGDVYVDWTADEWESSNLGGGNSYESSGTKGARSLIGFVAGALVAAVVGAAFMISRKRRQEEEEDGDDEDRPTNEGPTLKKRMKIFRAGMRSNRGGSGAPLNDDDASEAPSFIEIAKIQSGGEGSYRAPNNEKPVIFENESMESDDSDM